MAYGWLVAGDDEPEDPWLSIEQGIAVGLIDTGYVDQAAA